MCVLVKGQSLLMGTKGCFAILVGLLDSKQVEVQSQVCALIMELCRENGEIKIMFLSYFKRKMSKNVLGRESSRSIVKYIAVFRSK